MAFRSAKNLLACVAALSGCGVLFGAPQPCMPLSPREQRVLALQISLDRRGFSCNTLDGQCGRKTQVALATYCAVNGLAYVPGAEATAHARFFAGETNLFETVVVTAADHAACGRIPAAPAEATVKMLCERLIALTEEHIREKERILGVGIAIRGITSFDGRVVLNSFGALSCSDYPLAQRVEEYTGYSAVMSNNVRALFAAQMFLSKERELHSQFFLRCEYGIGASLSINDRIWLGGTNQCSEIGHIPVIRRGGKPCSCGKSGCLETIASPAAIREDAICILSPDKTPVLWKTSLVRGRDALTVEDVLEAASCGDSGAAEIVDRAVSALSAALKSVIYIIDPAKIVLYGRMFENDFYLTRLLAELQEGVDAGHHITTEKSAYNQLLEDRAAGLLVIEAFIDNGGMQ